MSTCDVDDGAFSTWESRLGVSNSGDHPSVVQTGSECASVTSVQSIGGFLHHLLSSDVTTIPPGTKVQVLFPSDDIRTYTPEGMALLAWKHAGGSGSQWMANAKTGDELLFVGPQRSLEIGKSRSCSSETKPAALSPRVTRRRGLERSTPSQSDAADDIREAARVVGLDYVDVVTRGDTAATVEAIREELVKTSDALVTLTGGSELIVAVRKVKTTP